MFSFFKRPIRLGIQPRMLLVALAIGSLFLAFIAVTTVRQAGRDRAQARSEMRLVAALAGSRLDDHIGDATQLLKALAGALTIDAGHAAANDATLRSLAAQLPDSVSNVSLWTTDGSNIGSSETSPTLPRLNAADHEFLAAALRGPGVAIEAPLRWRKGGEWTAVFAQRMVREGQVVGVVSVETRLATLPRLLDPEATLPPGAVITLVDAQGRIVSRSLDAERWIGQPAPLDRLELQQRLAMGRGSAENTGLDGRARIFGFARSRSLPWLVYVGMPADVALASANGNTLQSIVIGLAMLTVGLLLAAWAASRITRPLRQLSADARRFGEGRFEHRSRVRSSSELGLLAHTLNRMADALQERIEAARITTERLGLALESSDQALFDWDIAADRIHYSARASTLRGGPDRGWEEPSSELPKVVHPDDIAHLMGRLRAALRGERAFYEAEYRVRHLDGHWIWLRSRGRVVERDAEGRALRLIGTAADISSDKRQEAELRQRAEFDLLTGLPNRALFNDRLAGAIERALRSGTSLALLYVDVDRFKDVNDRHGHEAGDDLLKTAAGRFLQSVRSVDTVARLAGDEFTVILEGLADPADAEVVARKLIESMRVPMAIANALLRVSVSIGIAFLEPGETDPARLLRRADEALYDAKRRGRGRYALSPLPLPAG